MSQHVFHTTHENEAASIMMGWDKPLQGYFMMIDKETDEDEPFWSNLDYEPSHPKDLKKFLFVLDELKIKIPQQMIDEILEDGKNNVGNKEIIHSIVDGEYKREIWDEVYHWDAK